MKNATILLCLTLTLPLDFSVFGQAPALPAELGPHQWSASVKVIGEDGNPIFDAEVAVSYDVPATPGSGQQTTGVVKGLTDTNGMFSATHTDSSLGLGIIAKKTGFYSTHIGHQFYYDEKNRHPAFTLLLKTIGQPIAMYAKRVDSEPRVFKKTGRPPIVFKKNIGFDLTIGDWVAPDGKGQTTDIIFTEEFNKQSAKDYHFSLTISFPNIGDGIQGFQRDWGSGVSDLLSSHEAPSDGYQTNYVQTNTADSDWVFYVRVRTVLDQNGNVVSANYGKIYGDFTQFKYYLNPTPNDRNIEFDVKHNLIGGLQSLEEVSAP